MHNSSIEPNSGSNNSGYESEPNLTVGYSSPREVRQGNFDSEPDLTVGYSSPREVRQGNFDDAYQENIYDLSNLADTPWTDSTVRPNPQLELELD